MLLARALRFLRREHEGDRDMSQPFTISLDSLMQPIDFEAMKATATSGGCSSSSCGSSDRPDDMDADVWERIKDHPCYSEEAHHYFGCPSSQITRSPC